MSGAMIDLLERTIHEKYHLQRLSKDWKMKSGVKLRTPGARSLGFSLDNQEHPPFGFLSASPPKDVAKMCDAIVALSFKQNLYVFFVERKTAHLDDYKKQLTNGKLFCDWLIALFKEHASLNGEPIFIGLLVWEPRQSPRKGTTSHQLEASIKQKQVLPFHYFFEAKNETHFFLKALIDRCNK